MKLKKANPVGKTQQRFCHWVVPGFSTVTDGAVSLKTMVKDTQPRCHETYPTSIFIDLVEVQVSRAHIGLLIQCTTSIWQCVCVSLFPRSNHSHHLLIKLVQGSNGCAVWPLSDLRPTKGLETHSYIFSTLHNWVHPPLRDASLSTPHWPWERAPCFSPSHCCPLKPCVLRLI